MGRTVATAAPAHRDAVCSHRRMRADRLSLFALPLALVACSNAPASSAPTDAAIADSTSDVTNDVTDDATTDAADAHDAGLDAAIDAGADAPPLFLEGVFPIAVYSQPTNTFATWAARGLNTLFRYEDQGGTVAIADWDSAATAAGFDFIRQPRATATDDIGRAHLVAWLQEPDEPDGAGTDPSILAAQYSAMKTADPTRPVVINLSGGNVVFQKTPAATYAAYFKAADWISTDFYPITGWAEPDWIDLTKPVTGRGTEGLVLDEVRALGETSAPQIAVIECSNQNLAWVPGDVGPTVDEFRGEVWDAVIHGARAIVYFPQQFNPFVYDATPTDVAAEMTKQNALITSVATSLQAPIDPASMHASAASPIEVGWRVGATGALVIALNFSHAAQSSQAIALTGTTSTSATVVGEGRTVTVASGVITDDFTPYAVHLYQLH